MDYQNYITEMPERKIGQHLGGEERGAIKALVGQWLGIPTIARAIGCAPSTVKNELCRGIPIRKSRAERAPGYSPKLAQAVYKANRVAFRKPLKANGCKRFIAWVVQQMKELWSLDSCYRYAKAYQLFSEDEMVSTSILYHMVWTELLPITPTELPEALKRKDN